MASMVDELRRQDMLRNSGIEMYSSPSLLSAAAKAPQAPKPAAAPAQQGPGLIQRAFPNTVGAINDRRSQIDVAKQTGGYGAALGQSARTVANPLIGFADDSAQMVKSALDPAAQALKTFATGDATPIGQEPAQNPLVKAATMAPKASTMTPQQMEQAVTATDPVRNQPTSATAQPASNQIQPGIYQHGRGQFSDSADGMGFAKGFTGQPNAQNNAAAEALAARRPLVQAAQAPQSPTAFIPQDSGGYGLLDRGARERRSAMMDAQQFKPGARTALKSLLEQQAAEPGQQIERDRMAQSASESAADRLVRGSEFQSRLGEAAADRALRSQEVADNSLTNRVKRDAAGMELTSAKQLADLRTAYINAGTPEEQAAAVTKLNALSGKGAASLKDNFMVVGGGQEWDEKASAMRNVPQQLIDLRTNQPVQGQGQQAAQMPAGMKRQVGTSGGKPVYEDASGKRFIGG